MTAFCQVVLSPEAWEQLDNIFDYIAAKASPGIAKGFADDIVAFCAGFDLFPQRGIERSDIRPGLRFVGFRRRVTIAFTVANNIVTIVGIFYGGQDIEAALGADD